MRYEVIQFKPGEDPRVLHTGIRRFNGAVKVRDQQVADTKAWAQQKAQPGDRVVEGPTGRPEEVAVVLTGPEVLLVIVTAIRSK